ncbi:MAG: ATP-binding protein [Taibaiella sp.]|nr:ATP-binding protein [Taibaiella sp.]
MSKIRIKNFGPIKEGRLDNDGWIDIKKVTVFIGDQGTGKSTIAKLISTFMWLEKALCKGDIKQPLSMHEMWKLFMWQNLHNYIPEQGRNYEVEYVGEAYTFNYKYGLYWLDIALEVNSTYVIPKIMYVPAERNVLSTLRNVYDLKTLPDALRTFGAELKRAQISLDGRPLNLPLRDLSYLYDEKNDASFIVGKDYKLDLLEASSGFHSLIPLFLVSHNLAAIPSANAHANLSVNQIIIRDREISLISSDDTISNDEKAAQIALVHERYVNKCFVNIVEEPEQNLFPSSQKLILYKLIEYANVNEQNKLIVTTHSPYIVNYLTLAVKAHQLLANIERAGKATELNTVVSNIVPLNSALKANDLAIYELTNDGSIKILEEYAGLPSDENYLNTLLGETNEEFAKLLDIQQSL